MNVVKLLLVEDDMALRETLIGVLVDAGFEVTGVANGDRAILELEEHASRFGVIVTDLKLGSGPDGWAVARRARELVSEIPVIYITGDGGHAWASLAVPNSVVLTKPFASAQLCAAISMLITTAGARRRS